MKGKIELVDGGLFIEFGLFKTALDPVFLPQLQLKLKEVIYHFERCPISVFGKDRSNVPLEIISKIILRYSSLQTTEIYLGKVSDTEAIRWIENLYA